MSTAHNEPEVISSRQQTDEMPQNQTPSTRRESSWPSVLFYIHISILGLYGIIVLFTATKARTAIFSIFLTLIAILGTTAGAHRLWAHKCYKANSFLRFLLMMCQTLSGQDSIYNWVRLHRLHHKTFKTDDDPFYSNKDFLSAHVFAQIRSLSPKQEEMLKEIDMKDLEEDKIVMFQKRFYWLLYIVFFVLLPINAPLEYWNDTLQASLFVAFALRYLVTLNICWLINSAHFIWGLDKNNKPSDSNMIFLVTKSYWPHYHYMLPWDYQTSEFGDYGEDCTTIFVRVFAALGWATELETVTSQAVKNGLTMAVDTDAPLVECIEIAAREQMKILPNDHYLDKDKYK